MTDSKTREYRAEQIAEEAARRLDVMEDSKTATERLREMLDERGEGHYDDRYGTTWSYYTDPHTAEESMDGTLIVTGLTPEQAIAATLGRPKVKKVHIAWSGPAGEEYEGLGCSGCGEWIDGDLDCIGEYDGPNFCHNCGGEFDGPLLCKRCGKLADLECGDMCAECYWGEGEGNDER